MRRQDQITRFLRAIEEAWNAGDAASYAQFFAPDAVYVTRSGVIWQGRPAIEEGHAAALEGPLADTTLKFRPAHLTFPALSVAVVVAHLELTGETSATRGIATFVLSLNGTEWAILAVQASEVDAVH